MPPEASNSSGNLLWILLTMTHVGCGACGRRMGSTVVSKLYVPLLADCCGRDSWAVDGCSTERFGVVIMSWKAVFSAVNILGVYAWSACEGAASPVRALQRRSGLVMRNLSSAYWTPSEGRRGKRGRIRPSDIVRCELQCRRRLGDWYKSVLSTTPCYNTSEMV